MNQPTHAALSVREMQQLAVAALDEMLSHDLPAVSWGLPQFHLQPTLTGQVDHTLTYDEQRDVVRKWARLLKAEVTEQRSEDDTFTTVQTVGEFENVRVRVWAMVDRAER